jgi:hypothetical protein
MSDAIVIRIGGDGAGADTAFKEVGAAGQTAGNEIAVGMEKANYSMMEARHGVKMLSEEIGLKMPRAVAGMIASVGPLGALFAAAFPILGVVALAGVIGDLIQKHEELAGAARKAGEEEADLQIKESDRTAGLELQNMKLEDEIAKIEGRPGKNKLAEALLESKIKADELTTALSEGMQKNIDELEKASTAWQQFKDWVMSGSGAERDANAVVTQGLKNVVATTLDVAAARLKLSQAGSEGEQKAAIAALISAYGGLKSSAGAALEYIKTNTPDDTAKIKQLTEVEIGATSAMKDLQLTAQNMDLAKALDTAAIRDKWEKLQVYLRDLQMGTNHELEADEARHDAAIEKMIEARLIRELELQLKSGEAIEKAGDAELKLNQATAKAASDAQADAVARDLAAGNIKKAMEDEKELVNLLQQEKAAQLAIVDAKIAEAQAAMDVAATSGPGGGINVPDYNNALAQYREYQAQRITIAAEADKKITAASDKEMQSEAKRYQEYLKAFNNEFANSFAQIEMGHETVGKSAMRMYDQMSTALLKNLATAAMAELEGLVLHKTINQQKQLSDAKVAASGAYKEAVGSYPPPLGQILGAVAAAASFAAVMAFDEGGMVPSTQMALVHAGEAVLTPQQTENLRAAADNGGGGDTHYHQHENNITTMDSVDFARYLKKNPGALSEGISHAAKNGHLDVASLARGK